MSRSYWRFEYQPALSGRVSAITEYVLYGTWEEAMSYFLETHVCDMCKEEMQGVGGSIVISEDGTETKSDYCRGPYSDPWATGCAAEWSASEVQQ